MSKTQLTKKVERTRRWYVPLFFFLSFSFFTFAQTQQVSGTVLDELDQPLLGANVLVQGTTNGAVADFDGNFTLEAPNDAVLVVSYTGYATQEIPVNGQTNITVQLQPDAAALEEVVVIGYGSRKKSNVTGATTKVKEQFIRQQASGDATRALQGSAAGVSVVASARPGQTADIRIRGLGTINGNNPLFVVDGAFASNLPPTNQIKSLQVLKDATSTAIYGSRGANGVVLVETISGNKSQPARVTFNVRTGIGTANSRYDIVTDPTLIGQQIWLEQTNSGIAPNHAHFNFNANDIQGTRVNDYLFPNGASNGDPSTNLALYDQNDYPITRTNLSGTDWIEELYRPALIRDYSLSVDGGSEKTTYAFNANYFDEEGVLIGNSFNRYSFRLNVDSQLKDWLKIGQRLGVVLGQSRGNTIGFNAIVETSPLIPVFDEGGNYAGGIVGGGLNDGPNPVGFNTREESDLRKTLNAVGSFYVEVKPIKSIAIKSMLAYDMNWFTNRNPRFADPENTNGSTGITLTENRNNNLTWNWTNTLSYNKTFNEVHEFELLLGTEAVSFEGDFLTAGREGFISDDDDFIVLNGGSGNITNSGSKQDWSLASYFARAYYAYDSKYMLEATVRQDRSSRFLKDARTGTFPSVSAGWVISREKFLQDNNFITYLKLRGGWGESGNDGTGGNYNGYSTFGSSLGGSYYGLGGSDGTIVQGVQSTAIGNPDAQWETTVSTNIALDATLFKRLNFSVDIWNKKTEDMLFPVAIPAVAGNASAPSINIGEIENKGIDIELNYVGEALDGELSYNIGLNFSKYKNEIVSLSDNENEFIVGLEQRQQRYTRAEIGTAFPEFYGYVVDGIFQNQAQADAHPNHDEDPAADYNQPGNLIIRDVDGNNEITPDDRTFIGNPNPDFTAGLNLGIKYKNFDFNATLYTSQGNDAINYYDRFTRYGLFQGPKSPDRLFRSWGSPYLDNNADAVLPKALAQTSFEQNTHSDMIQDASYIRLQNAQIGFNVPRRILDKLDLTSIRIYLMGTNLFTITDYRGFDPEIAIPFDSNNGFANDINRGIDLGTWPTPRQIIVGLDISL